MASTATSPYVVRAGEPARDREATLAVWRGNLGRNERMAAKYDWFYLRCPHGQPLLQLLCATDTGAPVGTATAGRRRLHWQGSALRAGVLVDLAVLPEHRSLGPALMLQQGLMDSAADEALDVLYGFPNPKAGPVFKRIGYRQPFTLCRYARVLRHAGYMRTHLPRWLATPAGWIADAAMACLDAWHALRGPRLRAHWSDEVDPRVDALWEASPKGADVVAVRDAAHLRWRFDDSPLATTHYLLLERARDRTLDAWFAVQAGDNMLHVCDFWSADGARGMAAHHIAALLRAAHRQGHASVSVEIRASDAQLRGWRACGFRPRGHRPVFLRWTRADSPAASAAWFLTSADEDE